MKIVLATLFFIVNPIPETAINSSGTIHFGYKGNISYGMKVAEIDQMIENAQRTWDRQCRIKHRCFK